MIQVLDILGKEYREIKEYTVRLDFDEETLKEFDKAGFDPPILEGKLNKELYFFHFKIEKHKVEFSENRVSEVIFMTDDDEAVLIIQYLIGQTDFIFGYFSAQSIENAELKDIETSDHGMVQLKRIHSENERLEPFDIERLQSYGILTFTSQEISIVIEQERLEEGHLIPVFRISKNRNGKRNRDGLE
ncbi:hypothetical protein B0A69_16330 [Chryseobacterium shigense]|uniref:Uncharacterized protein n=1 Tax=Chryseobacterium shigense TaxID=297244 RepID=A0A1N7HWJ8_9FLAO|nr:hypothetical protein [Chryseobacterium shigense]PQA91987.1 hypothetical protein B0A69_16330 [Chryseobacterium shigense]SIS29206.1 hypothetical protein SAMN05421639_101391 [Chryseobacterium shigense]